MYFVILLLGIGLSLDAFAVSISGGLVCKKVSIKDTLKIAFTFGAFQALMPFLGYTLGKMFIEYIDAFDHYIAFVLLLFIGAKMIYEGIKKNGHVANLFFLRTSNILLLGLATSKDAFIAGLSLAMTNTLIIPAILIIGITTFIFSAVGVKLGCKLGSKFEKGADIFGGCILIFLGFKTLFEGLNLF